MTLLQLFDCVQEADNNYRKVFFLDDTNQISDWPGVRLRFCSIWVNRYNGAVATIYLYGSLHNYPYTPTGYILSDINNNIYVTRLANNADLEKCTFLKTGSLYSTFQFNKNTSEPSLICCHHDGGSATLVGVWQYNYFATLLSTGQFTVRSSGPTELLIDNTAPYWSIGCISITPVLLTLIP